MSAKHVLVIDDSRSFAAILRAQLTINYKYEVVVASNYYEAEQLLKHDHPFFCAIVDIHLPDAPNGEAVNLTLGHGITSIVFTGHFSESLREDFLSLNVADYVLKQDQYNIDYVTRMVHRLDKNSDIKVLVVDDSRTARGTIGRLLNIQRYQVLETGNGYEALELVEQHDNIFLAMIDRHMEMMDGFTLATRLRSKYSHESLAIIGVSGQTGRSVSAQFIKSGANDFLLKPFSPEEFYCRVNQNVQLVEQFKHMQQLNDQKNRLLGMAAHDIRGPLGSIVSLCELLQEPDGLDDRDSAEQFIHAISHSSQDALELLNNLLDISSIESGQFDLHTGQHNLATLLDERVTIYRNHARRKDITIDLKLIVQPAIDLDPMRIKQVIDNLLSNAIKFSPYSSLVNVVLREADDHYRVEVIDQGPGISKLDQEKLFGAYSRLSNKPTAGESSSGLGLAICQCIIRAHKGKIGIADPKTPGSHFYFTLPKAPIHAAA